MTPAWWRRTVIAVAIVLLILVVFCAARRVILGPDRFTIERTRPMTSRVDGLRYRVHENHTAPQQAADTLAAINSRVVGLLRSLQGRYVRGKAGARYPARQAIAAKLLARYNPDNLAENSPKDPSGDTSYTLDKGAVIALCLRERDPKKAGDPDVYDFHDLGTLTFVALHEMAHIAIDDIDHPPRFWSAFRFLLEEAEDAGIFVSPDYTAEPRYYCGVRIDYNPRYDPKTKTI